MRRIRLFSIIVLNFILIMSCVFPAGAYAATKESQTVKVGYVISPGYQEGQAGEYKTGQGYEYLQKISMYTGWNYEYVYGGFEELLKKLADGDIDLMGNITYTEERAREISFGSHEQGRESFYLHVNGNKSPISADDYTSINGKKIGVSSGSYQEKLWEEWCQDNDIHCDIVKFTSFTERQEALNSGRIDGTIGTLMQSRTKENQNWKSVLKFGDAPFYFAVNKERKDLLRDLNMAQSKILQTNPYFNDELSTRYLHKGILNSPQLSEDEINWLKANDGKIVFGCLDSLLPISDRDKNGDLCGMIPDFVSYIQDKYEQHGLLINTKVYDDYQTMLDDLKTGEIDVAAPVIGDLWNAEEQGICITNSMMSTPMLLLHSGDYSPDNAITIGINKQSPFQETYAKIYFGNAKLKYYDTTDATIRALDKGKIDAALAASCIYQVVEQNNDRFSKMHRITLPENVNIALAVSKQNPDLVSFLNRQISSMGETEIFNSVARNSNVDAEYSVHDFIVHNPAPFAVGIVLIIAILLFIIVRLRKAIQRAQRDSMTGLLNKNAIQDICKVQIKQGGILFMIDMDNFKTVNDILGHDAGDEVILHLAKNLKSVFRADDVIGRFGGDEFIVFMTESKCGDEVISGKVASLQESFETCKVLCEHPEIACSVSVGVMRIEPKQDITYSEAFKRVDDALYKAKQNGKKTFVMVE